MDYKEKDVEAYAHNKYINYSRRNKKGEVTIFALYLKMRYPEGTYIQYIPL